MEKNLHGFNTFSTKICLSFESSFPQYLKIHYPKTKAIPSFLQQFFIETFTHSALAINPCSKTSLLQNISCSSQFSFNNFPLSQHLYTPGLQWIRYCQCSVPVSMHIIILWKVFCQLIFKLNLRKRNKKYVILPALLISLGAL